MKSLTSKVLVLLIACMLLQQSHALSFDDIKKSVTDTAGKVASKVGHTYKQAKNIMDEQSQKATENLKDLAKSATDTIKKSAPKFQEAYESVKQTASGAYNKAARKFTQAEDALVENVKAQTHNLKEMFLQAEKLARKGVEQSKNTFEGSEGFWSKAAKFFSDSEVAKQVISDVCQYTKEKFITAKNFIVAVIKFFFKGFKKVCRILKKVIKVTWAIAYKYVFRDLLQYTWKAIGTMANMIFPEFMKYLWSALTFVYSFCRIFTEFAAYILANYPGPASGFLAAIFIVKITKKVAGIFW